MENEFMYFPNFLVTRGKRLKIKFYLCSSAAQFTKFTFLPFGVALTQYTPTDSRKYSYMWVWLPHENDIHIEKFIHSSQRRPVRCGHVTKSKATEKYSAFEQSRRCSNSRKLFLPFASWFSHNSPLNRTNRKNLTFYSFPWCADEAAWRLAGMDNIVA